MRILAAIDKGVVVKAEGLIAYDYNQPESEKFKLSLLKTITLVLVLASSLFLNVGGKSQSAQALHTHPLTVKHGEYTRSKIIASYNKNKMIRKQLEKSSEKYIVLDDSLRQDLPELSRLVRT